MAFPLMKFFYRTIMFLLATMLAQVARCMLLFVTLVQITCFMVSMSATTVTKLFQIGRSTVKLFTATVTKLLQIAPSTVIHLLAKDSVQLQERQKRAHDECKIMESRTSQGYLDMETAMRALVKKEEEQKQKEEEWLSSLHQLEEKKKSLTCDVAAMRNILNDVTEEVKINQGKAFNLQNIIHSLEGKALQSKLQSEVKKEQLKQSMQRELAEDKQFMAAELDAKWKALCGLTEEVKTKEKQVSDLENLIPCLEGKALQLKLQLHAAKRDPGQQQGDTAAEENAAPMQHLVAMTAQEISISEQEQPALSTIEQEIVHGQHQLAAIAAKGKTTARRQLFATAGMEKRSPGQQQQTAMAARTMQRAGQQKSAKVKWNSPGNLQCAMAAKVKAVPGPQHSATSAKDKRVPLWERQSAMTAGQQTPTMAARLIAGPGRQQPAMSCKDTKVIVQPWMTTGKKVAPATVKQQSSMAAMYKAQTRQQHTSSMAANGQQQPAMAAKVRIIPGQQQTAIFAEVKMGQSPESSK